jgi:hypothetical protein
VITADNITDEQIREHARGALTAAQHKDCTLALGARREMLTLVGRRLERTYPTTKQRKAARARIAAILNARAKSSQMITADTITDEQIRQVRADSVKHDDYIARDIADLALGVTLPIGANLQGGGWINGLRNYMTVAEARARCAEILNARAQEAQ